MQSDRRYDGVDGPKVAIAHDYLTQLGGAEKMVLSMSRAFPNAPIHTLLYDPALTYPEFADRDIRVSAANKVGPLRRHHRVGLPIWPLVANSMFVDADVVLTSSSGWAHGFRTRGRKLIYCYSPARWLYLPDKYLGEDAGLAKRIGLAATSPYLKAWDRRQARSADKYLAISTLIKGRIADAYGIDSDVVFGPAEMSNLAAAETIPALGGTGAENGGFYLCVSRLLPYKNVDVVIRAFANTDRQLVVVGRGPEAERLRGMKTSNVHMLSDLTDGQISWLYENCRALIAASYEDFGLTPIEAGMRGRPTVAVRWGGFLDTVDEGLSGIYFDEPEPKAIAEALDRFEQMEFDPDKIRRHVEQFDEEHFAKRLYAEVDKLAGS
ncbi:glycosyl transferase family 1 [Mycobacterium sp. ACS1612]|uniref:glycosyltransferase n=1 Tax=Mycobacterium sp. ACS1612 TaxID=1834117 RepID=UPI0008008FA6|nr:glycosyltransferase [Mycobacterium sp. ACS1612]OBF30312.1 glycosyl transferase family 1 [Mycobacterium sp. ACS1612]